MSETILYPLRNSDITTRLLGDGRVVLFNGKTMYAHVLSPLGSIIWEFCDGDHTIEQIASETTQLAEGRSLEEVHTLTVEFLADLQKIGLVIGVERDCVDDRG